MISIVVPVLRAHDVAGLDRVARRACSRSRRSPTTSFTGSPSRAIAPVASSTAAPPDMSNFISAIFAPGLIEMPPESNVTRLADEPEHRAGRALAGS